MLRALIDFFLPGASNDEVASIIELRHVKPSAAGVVPSQLLQGEDMKVARDVLDDDDADDVENEIERNKTKLKENIAKVSSRAASSSEPGGSGAAPAAKATAPPLRPSSSASSSSATRALPLTRGQTSFSAEDVRALAPLVSKSTISRESHWHHRWRGQYDGKRTSKVFIENDASSDFSAVIHCLTFLWAEHTKATGQACPWSFPE